MCRRERRSAVEKERDRSRGVSELRSAAVLCEVTIVPRASPLSSSARALAISDGVESAATAVNWDQNCCCVPRAVMEVADSVPILPLLRLVVFTFDTYSIWILYSAVTTITVVDLLPLLP
ncbi:uncharacterized protein LOC110267043 [Arachis ipaensis]|uniref:uncharacterized protein LOC110267043 n=1 Tax=Arachis ipaensis TaxID=130454 RepID=UPI000A2B1500|nr:uncharacterized protein LOC110267043 [Arachis ipaensis]